MPPWLSAVPLRHCILAPTHGAPPFYLWSSSQAGPGRPEGSSARPLSRMRDVERDTAWQGTLRMVCCGARDERIAALKVTSQKKARTTRLRNFGSSVIRTVCVDRQLCTLCRVLAKVPLSVPCTQYRNSYSTWQGLLVIGPIITEC